VSVVGEWPEARGRLVRQAVSVGVASGTYGVSFGALSTSSGLSLVQTCALSVLMFTGGSQFALLGVLAGGGSAVSGSASAVLLGIRNALYGARLAPTLGLHGWRRLVGAQLVIDESTAVSLVGEQVTDDPQTSVRGARLGFWATGLSVFLLWNLATLVGALVGDRIGDPRDFGLDAAVPAAFLAMLAPRLHNRQAWVVAVLGAGVAVAVVPLVPAGLPILVAALVPVLAVLSRRSGDPNGARADEVGP
jgi:predicted branched-subunit amino acid permease